MVFEIFYSRSQISQLARWNLILILGLIVLCYYILKWQLGIISLVLCCILFIICYGIFIRFNKYICIKNVPDSLRVNSNKKAVLITGCDTGFGFRIAKQLNEKGFQVFAGCLSPFENGAKELSEESGIHVIEMNVALDEDASLAVKYVKNNLGQNKLWAIINNAGISKGSEMEMTTMDIIREVIDVNLFGTIRVTKAFLPLLRTSQGRVINVASAAGRFIMPGFLPYSISKNAIIWFSDGLRLELSKYKISVVTIEPWIYKTRLANPILISKQMERQRSLSKKDGEKEVKTHSKTLKQNTENIFGTFVNPNIQEVINLMEDAVTCKYPPYIYRPGKLYLNLFLTFLLTIPKPVSDYVLRYFVFKQ